MNDQPLNIAVIGGGVAGITASHLMQKKHRVTLLEKNSYLGGHTNTITITDGPDAGTAVDTGFIVLNNKTYPTFHKLLSNLNVKVRESDMSFGFHCEKSGLQYAGTSLNGLFAQRSNLFNPSFIKMLFEIRRFCRMARQQLKEGFLDNRPLRQYLEDYGYSDYFVDHYLIPMGAAIWSTPAGEMLQFPAKTLLRFFDNHGLLSLKDRPRWQTVAGGSHSYVKAFLKQFQGELRLSCPVQGVRRLENTVQVVFPDETKQEFDRVILACHADEALQLLQDPTEDEARLLGAWKYNRNFTVLHTDASVTPPNPRAWASWNYTRETSDDDSDSLSLTYHMNRLQGLKTEKNYFVTLNRVHPVRPEAILQEIVYMHPMFDSQSAATQSRLRGLNGIRNTYFCGSYFGYGFHEDAVKSGAAVAREFGMEL